MTRCDKPEVKKMRASWLVDDRTELVIADGDGAVIFSVCEASPALSGDGYVGVIIRSRNFESNDDLRHRVMAALRTQMLEVEKRANFVVADSGKERYKVIRYPNGKNSTFEILPAAEAVDGEELLRHVVSSLRKYAEEGDSK